MITPCRRLMTARPTAPGKDIRTAWVELSAEEAYQLLDALKMWAEETQEGHPDPEWHTHVTDNVGRELTVSISLGEGGSTSRG